MAERKDDRERFSVKDKNVGICPFEKKCGAWIARHLRGEENWHKLFCAGDFLKCCHYEPRKKKNRRPTLRQAIALCSRAARSHE